MKDRKIFPTAAVILGLVTSCTSPAYVPETTPKPERSTLPATPDDPIVPEPTETPPLTNHGQRIYDRY